MDPDGDFTLSFKKDGSWSSVNSARTLKVSAKQTQMTSATFDITAEATVPSGIDLDVKALARSRDEFAKGIRVGTSYAGAITMRDVEASDHLRQIGW